MRTWLVILSVVAVLLAASTGVAFWMSMEAKAELTDIKADLMDTRAELTDTKVELVNIKAELTESNEKPEYDWSKFSGASQSATSQGYWWEEPSDQTARDIERRIQRLEAAVAALQSQVITLQSTLQRHGIY